MERYNGPKFIIGRLHRSVGKKDEKIVEKYDVGTNVTNDNRKTPNLLRLQKRDPYNRSFFF